MVFASLFDLNLHGPGIGRDHEAAVVYYIRPRPTLVWRWHDMARAEIDIKAQGTGMIKLSPAPILPAMSFDVSNQTGVDIKIIIDGKKIRLEAKSG
jgi:hypothetical protein